MTEKWTTILTTKEVREQLNNFKEKHDYDSQHEAIKNAIEIADEQLTK